MQGSRVTVVKEAGQFFPFGVLTLHSRLKQGFLDIARHVAPNVHSCPQQVCVAFLSVGHRPSECSCTEVEPRTDLGVPLPSLQKGAADGTFYQRHQNHG
jgi:hypothetical protein